MKAFLFLASALVTSATAQAADLGVADLPRIHAEYKANQARWAREFLDKTFAATMTLGSVSNALGNDKFMVAFMESPSDWMPGVACRETTPSDFLISKNKGDSIFVRGVVEDHSFGSLDLRDANFSTARKPQSTLTPNDLPTRPRHAIRPPDKPPQSPAFPTSRRSSPHCLDRLTTHSAT